MAHLGNVHILLVEDDCNDTFLLQEAFDQLENPPLISTCEDGVAAQGFLQACLAEDCALPDIILLDLNMPRMDGLSFLRWLRAEASVQHIPTLVLSTSVSPTDVRQAYLDAANGYLSKPRAYAEYGDLIRAVEGFWLKLAHLPGQATTQVQWS